MALRPDTALQYLKGVGPKLSEIFSRKGLKTVQELAEFFPRSYEDQRHARNLASLKEGETVRVKATVVKVASVPLGRSKRRIYDLTLKDASGIIHCKFFRVPFKGYFERLASGKEVQVVGEVKNYRGRLEFHHPDLLDIEQLDEQKDVVVPLYTEIEGLSSQKISKLIKSLFSEIKDLGEELLPEWLRRDYSLVSRSEALYKIHHPTPEESSSLLEFRSSAQKRIIFEEFFWMELLLAVKKSGLQREKGPQIINEGQRVKKIRSQLPFRLTVAQERAISEIERDLTLNHPMNRLVQGDVGSGKTLVCLLAAVKAAESRYQSCLMVPTEILAEQHYKSASQFLGDNIKVALLTGKTKSSERNEILEKLIQGEIDLLVGTHALIENPVQFKSLGLVIVDEQHRFGVDQRGLLKSKGSNPHFLLLTATPIPRTLAMTVYGDLEVSIIDELPPGRTPIQTRVAYPSKRAAAFDFMSEQIKKGRQAYIVYPLVEESEKIDLKNAVDEFDRLQKLYPDIRFGLLHGKMKPVEKEEVMQKFRQNEFQVLVSTTVIEVGVDVPNANVMIVEHAERFGLSQLHQLRGRVGRGEHKSFCILSLGYAVSDEARSRVEFMEKTQDGFKIAEFDLEMRGPGEFMGRRQSGLTGFKMANLVRDLDLLLKAREAAFLVLKKDPMLNNQENQGLKKELFRTHGPVSLANIS
ncbi:MAG: ATP-dependent DNA helicase RecG [Bdellovibrionales bacterium]